MTLVPGGSTPPSGKVIPLSTAGGGMKNTTAPAALVAWATMVPGTVLIDAPV